MSIQTFQINTLIAYTKHLRNFNVNTALQLKIDAINKFYTDENLDTAIIGLSGGVDSALVYYLFLEAANRPGSPIKKVVGIFMPINTKGITGQDVAQDCVDQLIKNMPDKYKNDKQEYFNHDLTNVVDAYYNQLHFSTEWVSGQLACIARTPVLYGMAAEYQIKGYKSIVVGTTNRDEGCYIGFYGKASDGMVDLQPIGDFHKSEVYQLAYLLNVPQEIMERKPMGDVWDSKVDEEMFGAPYHILEMWILVMENKLTTLVENLIVIPAHFELKQWIENLKSAHAKNLHKYKVGSPARYIDVMPRKLEF